MAEYIEYHPLKFWLDPASIAEIVAHIQSYLVANPINSTTEIETIIHDYLIAHPEIIGGVRSINGETGEVVLTADNISGGENVTIKDVLDSLQDQIDDIVASIPSDYQQLINDVSDLKSAVNIQNTFNWASLSDGSAHPYGFKRGYYQSSDGTWHNSQVYMCTVSMFAVDGVSFEIAPPSDFYVVVREYSSFGDYTSLVKNYGNQANGEPVTVPITNGRFYVVNCGRFTDSLAEDLILDENFVNSFVMTVKTTKIIELDDRLNELDNSTQPILNASMSMFSSFGVCGASWDSGYVYPAAGTSPIEKEELSWGANLARRNGNTYNNFSRHSVNTRTYLISQYCLPKLLAANPCNLYVITLGGNDSVDYGTDYLGSIEDITSHSSYADYPDTFYGNYGKIIEQIKEHAPDAKIILCMWYDSRYHTTVRKAFSDAVSMIAQHYGIARIQWADDDWYGSAFMRNGMIGSHPTAVQLSGVAYCFERLYSKCVAENYQYFSNYTG